MKVVLYSIGCPKCRALEKKLEKENINFTLEADADKMIEAGFKTAPILEVVNEKGESQFLDFNNAIKWINNK